MTADRARRRTAASVLLLIAMSLGAPPAAAQQGAWPLPAEPFRWSEWEMPGPGPDSAALDHVGICPRVAGQAAGLFHWMDVDGDGVADLVFSGPTTWCTPDPEGSTTAIYLNRGGSLVLGMREGGEVVAIWRPLPAHPVSLLLRHSLGEGLGESRYAWYTPHVVGDSVRFQPAGGFAVVPGTRLPERLLTHPRAFSVRQQTGTALLRTADADSANVLVTFARGSRGFALAEWTDAAGVEWWFVQTRPLPDGPEDVDDPYAVRRSGVMGWMPAHALTADSPAPGRVNTLSPFRSEP